uniref:Malate dehydrogenase 1B, NAD (Soluble) n=1 Tax=Nothobranchius furzeri TaxID=105023 RepID=A0A1A8U0F7_NOTFU
MNPQVTVHRDLEQAFHRANVIILLDDLSTDGEENDEKVKEASVRYRAYGQLIDQCADKQVKVIVSGDAFASLRCSLLAKTAHSIDSQQFVAMATQLEDAARAIIAKEMKVRPSGTLALPFTEPQHRQRGGVIISLCCCRCGRCFCVGEHQW